MYLIVFIIIHLLISLMHFFLSTTCVDLSAIKFITFVTLQHEPHKDQNNHPSYPKRGGGQGK